MIVACACLLLLSFYAGSVAVPRCTIVAIASNLFCVLLTISIPTSSSDTAALCVCVCVCVCVCSLDSPSRTSLLPCRAHVHKLAYGSSITGLQVSVGVGMNLVNSSRTCTAAELSTLPYVPSLRAADSRLWWLWCCGIGTGKIPTEVGHGRLDMRHTAASHVVRSVCFRALPAPVFSLQSRFSQNYIHACARTLL